MKKIIMIICLFAASLVAGASERNLNCTLEKRSSNTALVAGEEFKISIDGDFGVNANFNYGIKMSSDYLGICMGRGTENNNPLAEGWNGTAIVTGPACAADGFDIYLNSCGLGKSCFVQVNASPEDVLYKCNP